MLQQTAWLYWLPAALGALGVVYVAGARRREAAERAFGRPDRLAPAEAARRRAWRTALRLGAVSLLFAALAGPQWGVELVATQTGGGSALIAVDVSRSMTAEDAQPTRLEKAKRELAALIDELGGERVGVLAFAGQPGLMCPLTVDREAAKQLLYALEPGAVPAEGTAIGAAVREGVKILSRHGGRKALVLLTDGEDHRTDPLGAADEAARAGVRIFAIGIGSPQGEPVPTRGPDGRVTGYLKDARGNTVVSRLDEANLTRMAERTGGAYYRATPAEDEASQVARAIRGLEGGAGTRVGSVNRYKNRFQLPLALAFLLLLAELLVPLSGPRRLPLPERTLAAAGLFIALATPAWGGTEEELRQGNALYGKKRYAEALPHYEKALKAGDPRPLFNAGAALYRLGDYEAAAEAFAASRAGGPAEYNLGNALLKAGKNDEAVKAFRGAVMADPGDAEARHNLAVALKRKKNPPQPQGGGGAQDKPQRQDSPPRPQSQGGGASPRRQLSLDDAERLLQGVKERERAARNKQKALPRGKAPGKGGELW